MKKKRTEGKGRKELQKDFFCAQTSSCYSLQGLHSASNPISQKVLSFMGQMIQLRYYCTGRQGEDEMKHYHKVTPLLGLSAGRAALMLGINLKHCTVFYDKMNYDFDNGRSDSRAASAWKAGSRLAASRRRSPEGVISVSQRRLLFSIRRDPGRGRTAIKTLKKERAIENKWEQFVSAKVFFTLIYSVYLLFIFIFLCCCFSYFGLRPLVPIKG